MKGMNIFFNEDWQISDDAVEQIKFISGNKPTFSDFVSRYSLESLSNHISSGIVYLDSNLTMDTDSADDILLLTIFGKKMIDQIDEFEEETT